ncbi:histidine triad (HIT) protein [Thermovirga lienii DSM 17291]|uniref:Histidine triad (HIT) protein n=1 Tax=Thermovirga lienii (strain ATCC BAA-1197 / DSM 17291 / Cas60314) TaxID=580340 RepID=G7V6G0_THELD|nr:histidine triad nucleotide-binding protein [Thermovirga lienii]AER67073.1 histidine triad (HIT) protein [Thermovirga lienii DSM 17291]KUK42905.1 MAG: Histidine triad (HIT) protein [Thermovirga lienii]MDN5318815.1 histidine triad family protein [Thermovirga sp.]
MSDDCIFCRIIKGELPAQFVYKDEKVVVIRDINPQAPTHLLVIPREHVPSADKVEDPSLWSQVMGVATKVAKDLGLVEDGYRVVLNCGDRAGQTIYHLHVHVLSGRFFRWPPG